MSAQPNVFLVKQQLLCQGDWRACSLAEVIVKLEALVWPSGGVIQFNGADLTEFDSASAWLLIRWQKKLTKRGVKVKYVNFSSSSNQTLSLVASHQLENEFHIVDYPNATWLALFSSKFRWALDELIRYISFIGHIAIEMFGMLSSSKKLSSVLLARQIMLTGCRALPIIALLSFMVGVVLAYQLGIQLKNYGANVFIADLLGLSVLREFGPLLTAIMVAGRTGSSFTAELGMMKINQEIDALLTMGVSPVRRLILPRVIGLLIVLPLLTVWADMFGLFGGMVMAGHTLDMTWADFFIRLQDQVPLRMLMIGLGKAPVFALIIASVGCFQGMQVTYTSDSLGKNTTRSVVMAIFLIILADAGFSILFSWLRL